MKNFTLLTVLVVVIGTLTMATAQADPRPFAPCLWAREMSIPCFAFGVPADKEIGKFVEGVMINPTIFSKEEGEIERVFFTCQDLEGKEYQYFFRLEDMVGDPRETEWWQKSIYRFPADNLRQMVTEAISARSCPGYGDKVVALILVDMMTQGCATKDEIVQTKLPLVRIREIMRGYTDIIED